MFKNKKEITLLAKTACFCLLMFSTLSSCSTGQPRYHPGGPYYYKGWESYKLPYRPTEEITKAEAEEISKSGQNYYIAYFYKSGLIGSFEKYRGNIRIFKIIYYYEKGQLDMHVFYDEDGNKETVLYGPKGKPLP